MSATIRLALPRDAAQAAAIYAPFCTQTPVSFECTAPTPEEMARRIRRTTRHLPWLVLELDRRVCGYAYAGPHRERAAYRWSVDVAVYVEAGHRRRGAGRALYTALFGALLLQGYFKAYAGITLPNPASVGLHEALGFQPVGVYRGVGYKLGGWHDVGWYQLSLQPERAAPEPPQGVRPLLDTGAWKKAIATGVAGYPG